MAPKSKTSHRKPRPNDPLPGTYKMTPEVVEKLLKSLREGLPKTYACAGVGIDTATLKNWTEEFGDFRIRVEEAQKIYIEQNLLAIRVAGAHKGLDKEGNLTVAGDWRANAWLMERRFPKEFGANLKVDADVSAAVALDLSEATVDELKAAVDKSKNA
jgi:hypothetical protein